MIEEDYVSFEIAKLLRKKGFNEYCYKSYDTNGELCSNFPQNCVLAPTFQMVMKWLLLEYKFYVNVVPSVERYYWTGKWHSYVESLKKRYPFEKFIATVESPEEACEAAIKYCLENLI